MSCSNIVVIGGDGQLGTDLVKELNAYPLTHEDIEVCDKINVDRVLVRLKPKIVINCAAYVDVDGCEENPKKAFFVNAIGAKYIADVCNKIDAINFYISTDMVFDGKKGNYKEEDIANPINVYGLTKYAGEILTRNYCKKYYIIRTASLFGIKGSKTKSNFIEKIIAKAKKKEKLKVVDDIKSNPTYTKDVAKAIKEIIKKEIPFGVYHLTNKGYCSWYELAKQVLKFLKLTISIEPIKFCELNLRAKRPQNSSLSIDKLTQHGIIMRGWENALKDYLKDRYFNNQ